MSPLVVNALHLLLELMLWTAVVAGLHAIRRRTGPLVYVVFLSGYFIWMQTVSHLRLEIQVPGDLPPMPYSSVVLFPPLLAGLLLVYAIEGAAATRRLILALGFLLLAFVVIRWFTFLNLGRSTHVVAIPSEMLRPFPRKHLASLVALLADVAVVAVIYQFLSNQMSRTPDWLRAWTGIAVALTVALIVDAIVYPVVAGFPVRMVVSHLYGKAMASIVIAIMLAPYFAVRLTHVDAHGKRSTFDLFSLQERLARAETELAASEGRYRDLIDALPDGAVISTGGRYLYANPAFARMAGMTVEQVMATAPAAVFDPFPGNTVSSTGLLVESKLRRADGSKRDVEAHVRPVTFGEEHALLALIRDRTELLDNELQLEHAQRMEILGALAGGLAHDFNNRLGGIVGFATLAQRETDPDSRLADYLERVLDDARGASELSTRLLEFAIRPELEAAPLDVSALLTGASTLLASALGGGVEVELEMEDELPEVLGFADQLQHALLHLGMNSRDAMPGGGKLRISARRVTRREWPSRSEVPRGEQPDLDCDLLIEVEDEGCGIPAWAMPRIFDPLFSTKQGGGGTGLGLSMVYRFVRNSSGAITVTSEVGKGTRVQVFLPGRPHEACSAGGSAAGEPESPQPGRRPRRLIYVDDESTLRQLATRVLGPQGYEVLAAESGQDALALWREHGGFDLAILDIVMPGMDGEELCVALRELDPGLPVIFTSGYAGSLDTRRVQGAAVTQFLAKPFTPSELIQAASRALAAASS